MGISGTAAADCNGSSSAGNSTGSGSALRTRTPRARVRCLTVLFMLHSMALFVDVRLVVVAAVVARAGWTLERVHAPCH